jgi:opacity protein-like surface antigen
MGLVGAANSEAQTSDFTIRGFADAGSRTFTAEKSFKAVLGSNSGPVFGGGVEAVLWQHVFVDVRASRFRKTGHRVFVFDGKNFDLGIPATITIRPVELNVGYRFLPGRRVVPYGAIGAGWHAYTETSKFADASENVKDTFNGFQILGGAEVRLWRWIAVGGEAQWARVRDALGTDPNGVSKEFSETDLGGSTFRVKVIVGR